MLHDVLGKPAAAEPIGESWEVWEGDAVVGNSAETLGDLCRRFPDSLLGSEPQRSSGQRFPLLTKFIDAEQPLSVQVHPDDGQAQSLENQPNGKTEAWHIVEASAGAWVIHGLERPVEEHEIRERLESGTADELLHKVVVKAGDTVFVPAGTVHAIGPGILLHEVQQTSDVTYRLYDWNRQAHGSKRELHLSKGLQVSDLRPSSRSSYNPLKSLMARPG